MSHAIRRPFDAHLHLRDGDMMRAVVGCSAAQFGRAVVMPNVPAIDDPMSALAYRERIVASTGSGFEPLMTVRLTPRTTPEMVRSAALVGVVAFKVYPKGKTTGSEDGLDIEGILGMEDVYAEMERSGLVLCIHGEHPDPLVFCLDRERAILEHVGTIVSDFPRLRIVLEHITTADAVRWVEGARDGIGATITVHHLYLTLDDVLGGGQVGTEGKLHPHHYCAPIAKHPSDRAALLSASMGGNPKFFIGSDSAPHPIAAKESACGCAGVYSAPVALPALVERFDDYGMIGALEGFASEFGPRFYGLRQDEGSVVLRRKPWEVPSLVAAEAGGLRPFLAGRRLEWQVEAT